jgi:hypothetical protein
MKEWRYRFNILVLGVKWRWVGRFTSRPFCLRGKRTRYPLDRWLDGAQNRSGRCGGEKKSLASTGNGTPVVQPVTIPYELYRLCSPLQNQFDSVETTSEFITAVTELWNTSGGTSCPEQSAALVSARCLVGRFCVSSELALESADFLLRMQR